MSSPRIAILALSLGCIAWLLSAQAGWCSRVILTPSGETLAPNAANGDIFYSFEDDQATALWGGVGLSRMELEGAYFHFSDKDSVAVSAQTQILPETFLTPSASVGVRDLFNTTRNTSAIGYGGRAVYAALNKTYPTGPGVLFRNLDVNGGIGAGSIHGLFGSISAQMPMGLVGTFEYDSRRANLEVALPVSHTARLEYVRIGPRGFLGFTLNSPVGM